MTINFSFCEPKNAFYHTVGVNKKPDTLRGAYLHGELADLAHMSPHARLRTPDPGIQTIFFNWLRILRVDFESFVLRAPWAVSAHIWRGFRAWWGISVFGLKKGLFLRGSLKSRLGSGGIEDPTISNISIFSPPQLHPETSVGRETICFRKVLVESFSKSITLWGL